MASESEVGEVAAGALGFLRSATTPSFDVLASRARYSSWEHLETLVPCTSYGAICTIFVSKSAKLWLSSCSPRWVEHEWF